MANRPAGQNFISETDGNPNGVVTGSLNALLRDWNTDLIYICTSSPTGTAWVLHSTQTVATSSTAQPPLVSGTSIKTVNSSSLLGSGDLVVSAGPPADGSITNAKLADMATKTYKGRTVAGTGVPADVPVATLKTDLALVKGDVGLGNVDNTADANKPVSTAQAAAIAAINNNATYTTLMHVSASHTAAKVAGTYALSYGNVAAVGGAGTLYPLGVIQIVGADLPSVGGVTTKLRIRAQLYTNDVAPTGNFTFGLYPITRPATSGGAGLCIFTLGTVVAGSNGATFTTPVADLLGSAVGADFALPADGPYVIAVVTTATIAASAHVHLHAQLQTRNA